MAAVQFIGALSFEDRATCGVEHVHSLVDDIVMLDYGSKATTGHAARRTREAAWSTITDSFSDVPVSLSRIDVNPYSMRDLEELVLRDPASTQVLIDISCFTRPHVVAAARACLELSTQGREWSIVYTTPFSYGNLSARGRQFGWRDTLLLPLGPDPSLSNEGMALGLAIIGQVAERLQIALDEVEPAAGYAVHVTRESRPDIHRKALGENALVLRHLRSLKMPGQRAEGIRPIFPSLGWVERSVRMEALLAGLSTLVTDVTTAARAVKSPVFLYPFGPKVAGFAAAFFLGRIYEEASWCIYPIAVTHPLDYSEGCANVDVIASSRFFGFL